MSIYFYNFKLGQISLKMLTHLLRRTCVGGAQPSLARPLPHVLLARPFASKDAKKEAKAAKKPSKKNKAVAVRQRRDSVAARFEPY